MRQDIDHTASVDFHAFQALWASQVDLGVRVFGERNGVSARLKLCVFLVFGGPCQRVLRALQSRR